MHRLLKGPLAAVALSLALALVPRAAQGQAPDTAQLHRALAAALGEDFHIVRSELRSGLPERSGPFWLVYATPNRSGDFEFRYRYDYRDTTRPTDPLFTHVEHTSSIRVGEAGCRRSRGRDICMGDTIILPFVAGTGGHRFTLAWRHAARSDAGGEEATAPGSEAVPNPVAAHLRYVGSGSYEMLNRNGGGSRVHSATFEAVAPGSFNLGLSSRHPGRPAGHPSEHGSIPVIVVPMDQPVTVLLSQESVTHRNETNGFSSHTGNQYLTTPLLLQPGDRITLNFGRSPLATRQEMAAGADADAGALQPPEPVIGRFPFHVDLEQRFNAWIADHLPVQAAAGRR